MQSKSVLFHVDQSCTMKIKSFKMFNSKKLLVVVLAFAKPNKVGNWVLSNHKHKTRKPIANSIKSARHSKFMVFEISSQVIYCHNERERNVTFWSLLLLFSAGRSGGGNVYNVHITVSKQTNNKNPLLLCEKCSSSGQLIKQRKML